MCGILMYLSQLELSNCRNNNNKLDFRIRLGAAQPRKCSIPEPDSEEEEEEEETPEQRGIPI